LQQHDEMPSHGRGRRFETCSAHDAYDEVLAVWYPKRAAFLEMTGIPCYRDALVHRTAALEHASIIACTGLPTSAFR
jgi:hypothetical protein